MSPAAYQFVPWVERGAKLRLGPVDSGRPLPRRLPIELGVEVTGGAVAETIMEIHGPGDIVGIDPKQIVRVEPVPGSTDFEPNYFAHLELADATLPWLFTPGQADRATDRLRPWCVLVVVQAKQGVEVIGGRLLEELHITVPADARRELPDLAESWAWTHAQVITEEGGSPAAALTGDPRLSLARLLCPRRLDPVTSYHACLVPAFDAGVAAGLGEPVDPEAPLLAAWSSGPDAEQEIRLPVYHHWEFATGPAGDFEELVRRLRPGPMPDGVGRRSLAIGTAGSGLPTLDDDAPGATVDLEGALRPVGMERQPIPEPPRAELEAALQRLADARAARRAADEDNADEDNADEDDPPPLGAPLYGAWQARNHEISPPAEPPAWLRSLSSDPRDRVAAAAGARAVQANQEDLVHSAWEQLGAASTANKRLRETALARALGRSLHRRHLAMMPASDLVQMMGPSAGRLLVSEATTLAGRVASSVVADAAVQPNFRRALRPTTRLRRSARNGERAATTRGEAIERLNSGTVQPKRSRSGPDGAMLAAGMTGLRVQGRMAEVPNSGGAVVPAAFAPVLVTLARAETGRGEPDERIPRIPSGFRLAREIDVLALTAAGASGIVTRQGLPQLSVGGPSVQRLPVIEVSRDVFDRLMRRRIRAGLPSDLQLGAGPVFDPTVSRRYTRAVEATRRLFARVALDPPLPALTMADTAAGVLRVTEPGLRSELRASARIDVPAGIQRPPDALAPLRGAPSFPIPLVELIAAVDREYVLPGLHLVEANSVGLLEPNRRFIEAAIVGANHEVGRELNWRRYPVDRTATFFRRFWNRAPGDVEVPPIADWRAELDLGGNASGGDGELILLVRGDLLRRYPGTIIYAAEAELVGTRRVLIEPPREIHPSLSASLEPDVAMRGFPLSVGEAIGDETTAGWFFVIASQPTEPRFGLDAASQDLSPPTDRKDLHWGHLAPDGDLTSLTHATVDGLANPVLGPLTWGRDAASQAAITLQDPVRIVMHARHLLGPIDA